MAEKLPRVGRVMRVNEAGEEEWPLWKYFTYPSDGTRKTLPIGQTKIDFYEGVIVLPDGTRDYLISSLKNEGEEWCRSIFVETDKDIIIWMDEQGSKTPVSGKDFLLATFMNFKSLWIKTKESTEINVFSCTNPESVVKKLKTETSLTTPATEVKAGPLRRISETSGGVVLHSGTVTSIIIRAMSTNSGDIYLGGVTDRPYSGFGYILRANEAISLDIDDFNRVYLFATVSGDVVNFGGTK